MHTSLQKLTLTSNKVKEIVKDKKLKTDPKIVIITKKFTSNKIMPLLESNHIHFGENKVQEAQSKWFDLKKSFNNLQLHMVGKLQSNKAKKAIQLFDYIHSLDTRKLAEKLSQYEKELSKKVNYFIEVNLGSESQKSGILLNELKAFHSYCTKDLSLNVIGLMCLPPIGSDAHTYFTALKNSADELNIKELSMGMSSDYQEAILCGSTYLRLGTLIMGDRPNSI